MKKLIIRLLIVGVLVGAGVWLFFAIKNRDISINDWFVGNYQKGVDVSLYQENVDFDKLKEQHIDFVYVKATEGSTHVDNSFSEKWKKAKEAGLAVGAYHYFSYYQPGAAQAENFIKTVGDLKGRLIPAVDMELSVDEVYNPPEKDTVVRGLKVFVAVLEEKYGVKPIIYSRKDYYEKYLADDFADYPKWVTNYYLPAFFDYGEEWTIWQYNDKGKLDGYSGEHYIDLNVLNNKTSLDSLTIK